MTVADLIAELQKMPPFAPVRILAPEIVKDGEFGEELYTFGDDDACEASIAHWNGNHVLIESR